VRRTSSPPLLAASGVVLWTIVFDGFNQANWLVAGIPTALFLATLILCDTYRSLKGLFALTPRQAAGDVATAAGGVLLWQVVAALVTPALLLARENLAAPAGFAAGCFIAFVLRLKFSVALRHARFSLFGLSLLADRDSRYGSACRKLVGYRGNAAWSALCGRAVVSAGEGRCSPPCDQWQNDSETSGNWRSRPIPDLSRYFLLAI
jgi:hypothetical protein